MNLKSQFYLYLKTGGGSISVVFFYKKERKTCHSLQEEKGLGALIEEKIDTSIVICF